MTESIEDSELYLIGVFFSNIQFCRTYCNKKKTKQNVL